ncbi:hypothetical protein HBA_0463 [Sodalis endosymbiont of Henestaris halophilus]|nr:hypothetical protein HBA_0463 [Sodalis endosymbiont of Henestaris halophilus]
MLYQAYRTLVFAALSYFVVVIGVTFEAPFFSKQC